MAPKSVTFRRHDHLVSVLFGDLLSHSYNITFSMFLDLVPNLTLTLTLTLRLHLKVNVIGTYHGELNQNIDTVLKTTEADILTQDPRGHIS